MTLQPEIPAWKDVFSKELSRDSVTLLLLVESKSTKSGKKNVYVLIMEIITRFLQ